MKPARKDWRSGHQATNFLRMHAQTAESAPRLEARQRARRPGPDERESGASSSNQIERAIGGIRIKHKRAAKGARLHNDAHSSAFLLPGENHRAHIIIIKGAQILAEKN